jgi:hypothetical protein
MSFRAAPPDGNRGRGRGRGRGGSEYGGGSERGGPGGSDYSYGRGRVNRGTGHDRGRGYRGGPRGGADRGWPRGRVNRSRGRGVAIEAGATTAEAPAVVEAGAATVEAPAAVEAGAATVEAGGAVVEAGGDVVEAGSYPLLSLPTLSSGRTGPLPAEQTRAIGVRRRKYGNAGRFIKLCSNHVEVKLDQGTLYHYDGMYLSYSWEDK